MTPHLPDTLDVGDAGHQPNDGLEDEADQAERLSAEQRSLAAGEATEEIFQDDVSQARTRVAELTERGEEVFAAQRQLITEVFDELTAQLHSLQTVAEELRATNQELRATHSELDLAQHRYRDLFEFAPGGYFITDLRGIIQEGNQAMADLLGLRKQHLAGKPFVVYITPDDRATYHRHLEELRAGAAKVAARISWQAQILPRDADPYPALITVARMRPDAGDAVQLRWLIRDISAQVETQRALLTAEKQALVGRLASSFAHEIGNPLQTLIGALTLMEQAVKDGEIDRHELLQLITMGKEETQRAARIVQRLRDIHRAGQPDQREPIDINKVIDRALELAAAHCHRQDVEVKCELDTSMPEITATADRMHQVVLNLVLNAVEAMPQGGKLQVRTRSEREWVAIEVADTGQGIEPGNLPHLFTPFFTTKANGMGLGLYVTRQIVNEHHGEIQVESEPGDGTTFTIRLPV